MSLLPYKYPIIEQNFATFIDVNGMCGYEELDTNPMTCKAALLTHIAVGENVNIDGMLESEARLYLANVKDMYNIKGTIQGALDALATIGLHTKEYPAEIVEYRDMAERTVKEYHNAEAVQGGTSFHNGGVPIDVFRLFEWYQIGVNITAPASARQLDLAYRVLSEVIPVRCEIVGVYTNVSDYHDGISLQDGSRNHGQWRFE